MGAIGEAAIPVHGAYHPPSRASPANTSSLRQLCRKGIFRKFPVLILDFLLYSCRVELRHLRYFVAVAEHLSFTKAAGKLRIAQPALSRQVRQLEDELGVKLLERNRRSVALTDAGSAFLAEAKIILQQSEQAVRLAQTASQSGRGLLKVGYVWGLFHSFVPAILAEFRRAHPGVAINLLDLTANEQASALLEGRLDAGFIGFAQEADAARLEKLKVGVCDFVAVLPKTHPAARKSKVSLAALSEEFFIAISEDTFPGASRFVVTACRRAGFQPRILQAAERGHTILGLVASNCGVAILPEPLMALPHSGVVFRPLTDPPGGELFLAWSRRRMCPVRDRFVQLLRSILDLQPQAPAATVAPKGIT